MPSSDENATENVSREIVQEAEGSDSKKSHNSVSKRTATFYGSAILGSVFVIVIVIYAFRRYAREKT